MTPDSATTTGHPSRWSPNRTSTITTGCPGSCNCPTAGCTCATQVYVTHSGTVLVVSLGSYADNSFDGRFPSLDIPLKKLPFFRFARDPYPKSTDEIPRRTPRPALVAERVDWARLPRRSPRNI